jgi:hypothetical protein
MEAISGATANWVGRLGLIRESRLPMPTESKYPARFGDACKELMFAQVFRKNDPIGA